MIKIDMWYDDKKEQATGLDIWFNDLGCFYSGNITIFDKIVGDYYADSVPTSERKNKRLLKLGVMVSAGFDSRHRPLFYNPAPMGIGKKEKT